MFGNLLDNAMQSTGQGPEAAVLVLFLAFALFLPMLYYLRETNRARAER
jgi:ABC-type spermidine/putrescine transport system permease subunit I